MLQSAMTGDVLCSTRWLRPFLRALATRPWEVDRELAHLGLSAADVTGAECWLPRRAALGALERLSSLKAGLGIEAAAHILPGEFDVLEYVAPGASIIITRLGEMCAVVYDSDAPTGAGVAAEFTLATLLVVGRRATGLALRPLEVHFRQRAPDEPSAHAGAFRAPLRFAAERDALWIRASALALPLARSEPRLHAILERHAELQLARLPRLCTFRQRVLELIHEELAHGNPGVDNLAHRLDISPRTFKRRLRREGTTHRRLVQEVRRALALRHLEAGQMSLVELSSVLGFSSSHAFHKAFRAWMGITPGEYRRRHRCPRASVPASSSPRGPRGARSARAAAAESPRRAGTR